MSRSRAKNGMHGAADGPRTYNIAVIGSGGVGKSAITVQYVAQRFMDEYDPTIEDNYRKTAVVDDEEALMNILDTAGQEEWGPMYPWANEYDAYVVVISILDESSPEYSEDILGSVQRVRQQRNGEVPAVLVFVGNKTDRADERVISYEAGKALADKYNAPYLEISAKNYEETAAVFELVVREMREKLPEYKPKPQPVPCSMM